MIAPKKLFKTDLKELYKNHDNGNEFPLPQFISSYSKYPPCYFYANESFNSKILNFLIENGELVYCTCNGKLKNVILTPESFKNGTFVFKYKNVFVKIIVKTNDEFNITYTDDEGNTVTVGDVTLQERLTEGPEKTYELMIIYTSYDLIEGLPLNDFEKFIEVSGNSKIHLFVKNRYDEYVFEPIKMNIPENIDIALNYGNKFVEIESEIIKRMNSDDNGIYMFHGKPGTGKSTFLKYLTTKVDKDFIYIPATMIESFTTNPHTLSSLLQKKNSVLILEDAEKIITKRLGDNQDSSAVTSLLNLSDGILGDILKCPIILTYNCPQSDIDDALKRKGRLQINYEFDALPIEDAKRLATHLGFSKEEIEEKITKEMAIAEIYNLTKKTEMGEKKKETKVIGFGK